MSDTFLEKAIQLAGDCDFQERPTTNDWDKVEAELGIKLPADHKRLVTHFGSGRFGDDLYLLNPAAVGRLQLSRSRLVEFEQEVSGFIEEAGWKLYPERGGLIAVASTTSRIHFFIAGRVPPSSELTMLHLSYQSREHLQMPLAEFVCRVYCNELDWAEDLRRLIWIDPATPFFVPFTTP